MSMSGIILAPYVMNVFDSTDSLEKLVLKGKIE